MPVLTFTLSHHTFFFGGIMNRVVLRKRLLREYECMARRESTCWRCQEPICAGDEQRVEVMALRIRFEDGIVRDTITVWKAHADPCNEPPNPDEDHKDQDRLTSEDMPLAA